MDVGFGGFGGFWWVFEGSGEFLSAELSLSNPSNSSTSVRLNAQSAATLPIDPMELIDPIDSSLPSPSAKLFSLEICFS
jgi:hypothetical protein